MKRIVSLLLVFCLVAALTGASGEEALGEVAEALEALPTTTRHSIEIEGQMLDYTAAAGRLKLEVDGSACEMFYIAYTLDGVEDLKERPVTFAFNGGPGSSSEWLHLGMLGPRRVDVDEDGQPRSLPTRLVDNPYSILDLTDLVFIDPVGTGYSRAAEGVDPAPFYTYSGDIASVSEFIRKYVAQNRRWGSEKYVVGESYGTVRAAGVTKYLSENYDMGLNGVMLVSSVNDMLTLSEGSLNDLACALYLPSYAAIGWYHGLLDEKYQSMPLETYLEEVSAYAGGAYQQALFKGVTLTDEERNAVAGQIAAYTGLKSDFVLSCGLRIGIPDICGNLLKDKNLMVGRLDARYTGPITEGDIGSGDSDPSSNALSSAFGSAINHYLADELDYHTDLPYVTLSLDVNGRWTYGLDNQTLDQKEDIYNAMSRNQYLKWWVLGGYYDLATPYYAAEWVYNHVLLDAETRENLTFTLYPSGHMIYMHEPSLARFHREATAWYRGE